MYSVIRQLKVAHSQHEIEHLVWSNQVDLVAVSNNKGDVALHRLLWLKAWDFPAPREQCKVTALAWRPDGKVLSIAYTGGELLLVNVENKSVLHSLNYTGEITSVTWLQEKKPESADKNLKANLPEEEGNNYTEYVDFSKKFISKPPSLTNYESTNNTDEVNTNLLHKQKHLNLLLVGTQDGILHISIFGSLKCGEINLNAKLGCQCSIVDVHLSENLDVAIVTVKVHKTDTGGDQIQLVYLNTSVFETHVRELFCLAMKRVEMQTLLTYMDKSITSVKETWESILLEIDAKLSNYASKVQPGTLSADFLDLLMMGICSDDMQEFLFKDMTKRGLEKFGQNIEMSYANIQKLLLKNITKVGQNLTFHLSELRGMSRFASRYKVLGLDEQKIASAISASGSFLIKSGEMQQIINDSMIYYKTFFRWLYSAIINLMEEPVPSEIPNMTQQDLAYIAEFLKYFDLIGSQNNTTIGNQEKSGFIMERLGQYLANSSLTILTTNQENDWETLLLNNECLRKHPSIIKHYKEMSLIQQMAHLQQTIEEIYETPKEAITANMNMIKCVSLISPTISNLQCFTGINAISGSGFMYAFPNLTHDAIYFIETETTRKGPVLEVSGKGAALYVSHHHECAIANSSRYKITDVKFYTGNVLSLLLEDGAKQALLLQCPISAFRGNLQEISLDGDVSRQSLTQIDISDCDAPLKPIGMTASKFSVSGFRSVSVVLGDNKKKVMLFEMEAEEEEEEDAEMTTSTVRESDVDASMQEASDAE